MAPGCPEGTLKDRHTASGAALTVLFILKEELQCDATYSPQRGVWTVLFHIQTPQVADSPEVIHPRSVSPASCCSSIYTYFLFLSDSDIQRDSKPHGD